MHKAVMKFEIDYEGINRVGSFRIRESRKYVTSEFKVNKEVDFDIVITKLNGDILVDGNALCDISFTCSRCLEYFNQRIKAQINFTRKFDWENCKHVDLSDELLAGILLSVPMNPVCRDECAGLCSHCGKNRNNAKCGCSEDKSIFSAFGKLKNLKIK